MFSSLPLLSCLMESMAQLFAAAAASQPHFTRVSEENRLKRNRDDVSIAANVAAQKHFRQIQRIC